MAHKMMIDFDLDKEESYLVFGTDRYKLNDNEKASILLVIKEILLRVNEEINKGMKNG